MQSAINPCRDECEAGDDEANANVTVEVQQAEWMRLNEFGSMVVNKSP